MYSHAAWLSDADRVLEGGYTADTRHQEKIHKKREQHKHLMKALALQGYDARLMIFTFGVGGSIFQQAKDNLKALGVDQTAIKKVLTPSLSRMCR